MQKSRFFAQDEFFRDMDLRILFMRTNLKFYLYLKEGHQRKTAEFATTQKLHRE